MTHPCHLDHNYKGDSSVVLLAVVDAQLRFTFVDIGTNGRISDGGIWNKLTLKRALEERSLHIPAARALPNIQNDFPFVLVGDEGFPLSMNVLIPYPGEQCRMSMCNQLILNRIALKSFQTVESEEMLGKRVWSACSLISNF